jgi:cytochrome c oxidase subunit 3
MFSNIIVDPFSIPLLNSILLLSSGVTITCAHHYILVGDYNYSGRFLFLTVLLGVVFLGLQMFEYSHSIVRINSSVYGSVFFLLTGFHGLHVTIGAIFLLICLLRLIRKNISRRNHVGFETAS